MFQPIVLTNSITDGTTFSLLIICLLFVTFWIVAKQCIVMCAADVMNHSKIIECEMCAYDVRFSNVEIKNDI